MSKIEIVREIVTVASVLIKFGSEHILEKREHFIAFFFFFLIKNDLGRTLNQSNFRKMIEEMTAEEKQQLVEEFNEGFESVYRYMMMYSKP